MASEVILLSCSNLELHLVCEYLYVAVRKRKLFFLFDDMLFLLISLFRGNFRRFNELDLNNYCSK